MVRMRALVFFCTVAVCAVSAGADVMYLRNGDRVSGTLLGLGDGVMRFQSTYTSVFSVPWTDLFAVTTDEEVELSLYDSGTVTGRLILLDDAQGLAAEGEVKHITLDEVLTIAVPGVEMAEEVERPEEPAEEGPVVAEAEAAEEAPPRKWAGSVSAGATWRKGASDTFDAVAGVAAVREWPRDTLTLKTEAAYGEVESLKNTQRILGEMKWQHYWTDRFYGYGLAGAEHDAGRQVDLRLRANVGLGREFIKNEKRKLSFEAGVGYRREYWLEYDLVAERNMRDASRDAQRVRLNQFVNEIAGLTGFDLIEAGLRYVRDINGLKFHNDTSTEDTVNVQISSHYEQQVFARSLFTSDLTLEPDVDDPSNFRLLSDLAFLTPLSEKMSLKMRLNSEYDSDTGGVNAEEWEHKFMTGLEYEF